MGQGGVVMTAATAHLTRVKSFSAAGDRSHVGFCDTCNRAVGKQTTDRARAEQDAADHAMVPARVVMG